MLDAALTATRDGAAVGLALAVTNESAEPITLRFRTGQRADFAAYDADDGDEAVHGDAERDGPNPNADPVWRHAEGRLFTQALDSETLEPGTSATYEGVWEDPPSGAYLVVGTLTAEERDASATARVAVD
jgi:hypothetical protein